MKILLVALLISAQFITAAYCEDKLALGTSNVVSVAKKPSELPAPIDFDFAWDGFDHRGRTIWACRGVQTGAFVARELCDLKPKVDFQWPDKKIPGHWKPMSGQSCLEDGCL
jgi:hypothetical protein